MTTGVDIANTSLGNWYIVFLSVIPSSPETRSVGCVFKVLWLSVNGKVRATSSAWFIQH